MPANMTTKMTTRMATKMTTNIASSMGIQQLKTSKVHSHESYRGTTEPPAVAHMDATP